MSDIAISARNLGKLYHIGALQNGRGKARYHTFQETLIDGVAAPFRRTRSLLRGEATGAAGLHQEMWALKDVSFEVKHGEVVGIIGRNGAGKSTLLKILSRITEPTTGYADVYGRVGSLLEVGTGFHPELTGRENVYLNGAVLGMRRVEIDRKFDEIVDFSGVEQFIDTPVKHYSSGMYVRLAFAVAAYLETEILVVDEVLAVGDVGFQKKCLGKMGDVASSGRTVLFVSHNMASIENLCPKAILLESGYVRNTGLSSAVISQYLSTYRVTSSAEDLVGDTIRRTGTGEIQFRNVELCSLAGVSTASVPLGDGIIIRMSIVSWISTRLVEVGVTLSNSQGLRLSGLNSHDLGNFVFELDENETTIVECRIPRLNLSPGLYFIGLMIREGRHKVTDLIQEAASFEIVPIDYYGTGRLPKGSNVVLLDVDWCMKKSQLDG